MALRPMLREPDELRLVRSAAGGDKAAFEALVRMHQGSLHALVARYVWDRDDVRDLVQEVFLSAYRGLSTYDFERPFGPWLRSIARNRIVDHFRTRASSSRHRELDRDFAAVLAQTSEDDAEDRRAAALARCVERLPAHHRDLLRDRYEHGESVNDIAARQSRSATSVSMVLLRVRHALAKCMELEQAPPGAKA